MAALQASGRFGCVRGQAGPEHVGDFLPGLGDQTYVGRGAVEDGAGEALLPCRLDYANQARNSGARDTYRVRLAC